jgi:dGTPase
VHADGSPRVVRKFGVYDDDKPVFEWLRAGVEGTRRCLEAQVMDLADDVAYSVHDIEDGIVAGRIDLTTLDREAVWATVRDWYLPDVPDGVLDDALAGMREMGSWPTTPYDASRRSLAALKNLTSDLIGRFCGAVQAATFAAGDGPFARHAADLVVPEGARLEMAVLKGIAAHYVMQADDRVAAMARQRELLAELVARLAHRGPAALERPFADDWAAASDDSGRLRVVIDQVASLTDASAVALHAHLRAGG